MKVWIDGSTTVICYIIEGQEPVIMPASAIGTKVTGNQGEYYSLIHALEAIRKQDLGAVEIYSDSQLLVNQLTCDKRGLPKYATKNPHLKNLNRIACTLMKGLAVNLRWIPREENLAGHVLG